MSNTFDDRGKWNEEGQNGTMRTNDDTKNVQKILELKNRKTKIDDLGKCHNENRQFDSSIAGTLYINPFFHQDEDLFKMSADLKDREASCNSGINKVTVYDIRKSVRLIEKANEKAKYVLRILNSLKNTFQILCGALLFYGIIFILLLSFTELSIENAPISFLFLSMQFNCVAIVLKKMEDTTEISI